ncbi:MAG: hypothetical protein H8D67_25050 [Deltaproteobacteria bacterium]|nr:hypothetical protein [Deltaproteobacteria bacterium]
MNLLGVPFDPIVFLRDYGLQILAIVVPITIYLIYQRKKREFSYTILSKTRLFTIHDEVRDRLQVSLDGNPIEDVYLLIIRFQNSGNVSLVSADFESDVVMDLNHEAQIISNEVIETTPADLEYTIIGKGNSLQISPSLFNANDSITIKMLISDYEEIKSVKGRIVGVSNIKMLKWNPALDRRTRMLGFFISLFSIIVYFSLPSKNLGTCLAQIKISEIYLYSI